MFSSSFTQRLSANIARFFRASFGPSLNQPITDLLEQLREQSQGMSQYHYWHSNKSYNFSDDVCQAIDFAQEQLQQLSPELEFNIDFAGHCNCYCRQLEQQIPQFEIHYSDPHGIGVATLRDIILQLKDQAAHSLCDKNFLNAA